MHQVVVTWRAGIDLERIGRSGMSGHRKEAPGAL
jgi:hypothetical protein